MVNEVDLHITAQQVIAYEVLCNDSMMYIYPTISGRDNVVWMMDYYRRLHEKDRVRSHSEYTQYHSVDADANVFAPIA
jgi:hypothetical protein